MTIYPYLKFFNIQYWYCVFISLFGSHCTAAQLGIDTSGIASTTAGVSAELSGSATSTASAAGNAGFWEWLFGPGAGAAIHAGPLGVVVGVIGAVLGFFWGLYSALAYTASLLLFLLIAGALGGIFLLRLQDSDRYGNLSPAKESPHPLSARWQELLAGAMSSNPARWREAVLGADVLLGELFATLGYEGATTAERIRRVPDGAFANLPSAWEAHRVRNLASAPSSHFILTQREAFRVMKLYEQVFREFDFI